VGIFWETFIAAMPGEGGNLPSAAANEHALVSAWVTGFSHSHRPADGVRAAAKPEGKISRVCALWS